YAGGMRLARNYLQRQGYRLPTAAEMEYANRAGAVTARYYGETDELLSKYAWYKQNSPEKASPVGSLKPNDLGLFDGLGSVFTWCQGRFEAYPKSNGDGTVEDQEDELLVTSTDSRVLRGGSFYDQSSHLRCASRNSYVPSHRRYSDGFRLARTLRLGSFTA